MEFPKELRTKLKMISIPMISDWDLFDSRRDKAWQEDLESCPCCGKVIKNPQYFIHSAFGGKVYIPDGEETKAGMLDDTWEMAVGSECRKKFPAGYVFKQ